MWPWGSAIACATSATPHAGRPPPTSAATIAQDMPAKCCPAPCTFKARAESLAHLKPAQATSRVWCPHGRQRTDPAVFIRSMTWTSTTGMRERLLWPWKTKSSAGKLTCPKHVIFMSKCLEVSTGGWSMPGECLRDVALGQLAGCEMGLTLES